MDRAEEARLDRIIHALKLVVSRKTAEKAAHEVAAIAEAVKGAPSTAAAPPPAPNTLPVMSHTTSSPKSPRGDEPCSEDEFKCKVAAETGGQVHADRVVLALPAFKTADGRVDFERFLGSNMLDFVTKTHSNEFVNDMPVMLFADGAKKSKGELGTCLCP
jgi:hypothetical protein